MLNLVTLYLILSTLFLFEYKSINLLAFYIAIVLLLAIVISIFPEFNTFGGFPYICDISYISYILILVQISALTIIFGFIIMLYPNNNTNITIRHKKSIPKLMFFGKSPYFKIFISIFILFILYLISIYCLDIYEYITNLLVKPEKPGLNMRIFPYEIAFLDYYIKNVCPITYLNLINRTELITMLETPSIIERFTIQLKTNDLWFRFMAIPFDIDNITILPLKNILITMSHFLTEDCFSYNFNSIVYSNLFAFGFVKNITNSPLLNFVPTVLVNTNLTFLPTPVSNLFDLFGIYPYLFNPSSNFSHYYTNPLSHISFLLYADPSNILKFIAITFLLFFAIICLFFILFPSYIKPSSSFTSLLSKFKSYFF